MEKSQLKNGTPTDAILSMIGGLYGRWFVIKYAGVAHRQHYVYCTCSCGEKRIVNVNLIINGRSKSCGCLAAELSAGRKYKHGDAKEKGKLYYTWYGMKARCYMKTNGSYPKYGGIGVMVCLGWRGENGYINFKNDMGQPPDINHSIDRINTRGHYTCGHCKDCEKNNWELNCRWATLLVQANNKKNSTRIMVNDVSMTISEAARMAGLHRTVLAARLSRGWSIEDAINTKPDKRNKALKKQKK